MTVMVVAVMALVAVLNSGMVTLRRAADASTAAAVADKQMEAYRALPNCAIYLDLRVDPDEWCLHDGSRLDRHAPSSPRPPVRITNNTPITGGPVQVRRRGTHAQQTVTGADNRQYKVDTYIVAVTTPGAAKKVTLVVHNADNTKTLIRETSTFTPPTGCNNGTHGPVSVGC